MEDLEKDVAESVPAEETQEVVNNEQEATPVQEAQEEAIPSTPEVKQEVKDNRPIENVAWESKRKVDELYSTVNEMKTLLQEKLSHQQAPQTPTYTKAQLMAYASDPVTTTEQRLWAYTEVDKLEKEERRKEYETLVTSTRKQSETETRRTQAANWIAQTFPDTVVKDQMGNVVGWKQGHPLLEKANEYMTRNEAFRNDPEGFAAAVKLAAFDLGVSPTMTKKIDKTVGQLRKEQKKQLASAGGTRVAENPANASQARLEKLNTLYRETGDAKVFEEIVKMRKLNPFT